MTAERFDAIIVGGRVAGASLATRLGRAGLRVLLLDRDANASTPVISVPLLLNSAMALLDGLDVSEEVYARGTPKIRGIEFEMSDYFSTRLSLPEVSGRDYLYAVDRPQLDGALWERAANTPGVTARRGVSMRRVLRDEDRVVGVVVEAGRRTEEIRGRCVIGADGRYSKTAREVGSEVVHVRTDCNTVLHFAYWEGCPPHDSGEEIVQIHASCDGFSFVLMPSRDGRMGVVTQGRVDRYRLDAGVEATYHGLLQARPAVWKRLAPAQRTTPVLGIKFANAFRHPAGPGWMLVGDAFHHKDSYDAQGIYDALLQSQLLAAALIPWHGGETTWDEATATYEREAMAAMRPMFEATMDRIQREVYSDPPPLIARTVIRWTMTDPTWKRRFTELLTRTIEPQGWAPPSVAIGALVRGLGRDLVGRNG